MNEAVLDVGATIGGRWRIDRFIAAGGFGQVFAASDTSSANAGRVAAKVLLDGASTAERNAFLSEVRHTAALRHPNLVTHIDSGLLEHRDQGAVFLITELCDESLGDFLSRQPGGVLTERQLPAIVDDLCAGLDHLHATGRVHRDLKPANVLRAGPTWKLADFGLVRDLSSSGVYHLNTVAGTPRYMAPEFFAQGEIGPATDIWSLGVVVHELMTGQGVHHGDGAAFIHNLANNPPVISPTLQPNAAEFVRRCLATDPGARPAAAELPVILGGASPATRRMESAPLPPAVQTDPATTSEVAHWPAPAGIPSAGPAPTVITPLASPSPTDPANSGGDRRNRRWLLAGLAAAAVVFLGGALIAVALDRNDDPIVETGESADGELDPVSPTTDQAADGQADGDDADGDDAAGDSAGDTVIDGAETGSTESDGTTETRSIGDRLTNDEFLAGDCADPDIVDGVLELAFLRDCNVPHSYEVLGLIEAPEAGGDYPGWRSLLEIGATQCPEIFVNRWGIEQSDTSLQVVGFPPSEAAWGDSIFTIVCAVNRGDTQPLEAAIGDDASQWLWKSGDSLNLLELQLGHCFDVVNELEGNGLQQRVVFRDCDELHDGEHYAVTTLTDLPGADGSGYPADEILAESASRCHDQLHDAYGAEHSNFGFTSTAIGPTEQEWIDFRALLADCMVFFDEPVDRPLSAIAEG